MRYLSVCSGIEAATVAWHPLGFEAAAYSEIEPFPSAVLAHHYPTVPNLGDMTNYGDWNLENIDLLVGGTPCQSFSVAGLRRGLADPRGNLALVYLGIADRFRPRWIVWENVPGVLSSNGGRDFGSFLGALAQLGYGFAYRVLDAQFCGVPQRRRRVFVVGCLGDWRSAAAVLFERTSLRRDSAPRREAREDVAASLDARTKSGGFPGSDGAAGGHVQPVRLIAPTLTQNYGKQPDSSDTGLGPMLIPSTGSVPHCLNAGGMKRIDYETETMIAFHHDAQPDQMNFSEHTTASLTTSQHAAVAVHENQRSEIALNSDTFAALGRGGGKPGQGYPAIVGPLSANGGTAKKHGFGMGQQDWENGYAQPAGMAVRRLTPRECERLQGFPDDYTAIEVKRKPAADGPRYKALGNSMAVPVMRWIGTRIKLVEFWT